MNRIVAMNEDQAELVQTLVKAAYDKGLREGLAVFITLFDHLKISEDLRAKCASLTEEATKWLTKKAYAEFDEAFELSHQAGRKYMQQGDRPDA